jgi:hypothetical protein
MDLTPDRYVIVLEVEPHPVDPILRLRLLLKRARRDWALKCVRIEQVMNTDEINSVRTQLNPPCC